MGEGAEREPSIEFTAELDRRSAEVLQLEIRRLARRYGAEITEFRIETPCESVGDQLSPAPTCDTPERT
jgi:hypothetical protein